MRVERCACSLPNFTAKFHTYSLNSLPCIVGCCLIPSIEFTDWLIRTLRMEMTVRKLRKLIRNLNNVVYDEFLLSNLRIYQDVATSVFCFNNQTLLH